MKSTIALLLLSIVMGVPTIIPVVPPVEPHEVPVTVPTAEPTTPHTTAPITPPTPLTPVVPATPTQPVPGGDVCREFIASCVPVKNKSTNTSAADSFMVTMTCLKSMVKKCDVGDDSSDDAAVNPADAEFCKSFSPCLEQLDDSVLDECQDEFKMCYTKYQKWKSGNYTHHSNSTENNTHGNDIHGTGGCGGNSTTGFWFVRACMRWSREDFSKDCNKALEKVQEYADGKEYTALATYEEPLNSLLRYQWVWGGEPLEDPHIPEGDDYHHHHHHGPLKIILIITSMVVLLAVTVCCCCKKIRARRALLMTQDGPSTNTLPLAYVYAPPYTALDGGAMARAFCPSAPGGPEVYYAPVAPQHIPIATPVYFN